MDKQLIIYRLRYGGSANNRYEGLELLVQTDNPLELEAIFPRRGPEGGWIYERLVVHTPETLAELKRRLWAQITKTSVSFKPPTLITAERPASEPSVP